MESDYDVIEKFKTSEFLDYPNFYNYKTPLKMGLWVLLVTKDKFGIEKMTAEEISQVIIKVMEVNVDSKSIKRAFARAGKKIYVHHTPNGIFYEIMKEGKDYIMSEEAVDFITLFYFKPGKKFTSKRIFYKYILKNLNGTLKVVDPYCGIRMLDIFSEVENKVKILTSLANLKEKEKKRFIRELQDFINEHPNFEFRDYPQRTLHDRYIIYKEGVILLGHSIKNLGSKESFAIILSKEAIEDIYISLDKMFDKKWAESKKLP